MKRIFSNQLFERKLVFVKYLNLIDSMRENELITLWTFVWLFIRFRMHNETLIERKKVFFSVWEKRYYRKITMEWHN